jgi:hypothetical protein
VSAVTAAVGAGALEAIGQREVNLHWELTFRSLDKKEEFLAKEAFEVKGHRANVGGVRAGTCRMRVFYLPFYVPALVITEQLKALGGKLLSVTVERDRDGCCTNVRRIAIATDDINKVPDELEWAFDGMRGKVLINVLGRPARCMRCGTRGHRKFECEAPYCAVCRTVGHERAPTCKQQKKSYAAAASGVNEEAMDEETDYLNDADDGIDDNDDQEQQPAADATAGDGDDDTTEAAASGGGVKDDASKSLDPFETLVEPTANWGEAMDRQDASLSTKTPEKRIDHFDGSVITPSAAEPGRKRTLDAADRQSEEALAKLGRRYSVGGDPAFDPTAGRSKSRLPVVAPPARPQRTLSPAASRSFKIQATIK